ncbi:MAG: lactonase family protein [Caldilineaceae bacterium]|nr:lactonase family protein [Caldilineaceae bacterium]
MTQAKEYLVFVGTYTGKLGHVEGKAKGVYAYRVDAATGAMTELSVAPGVVNPSFVALDPQYRYLYAVSEVIDESGKSGGGVAAFRVDRSAGALTALNTRSSGGAGPCYVTVDATGKWVLTANYNSGSVIVHPIQPDGSLGEASDFKQHVGSSVNPQRQEGPHAHSFVIAPDNRFAYAPDLGMDKVMIYSLDTEKGKLTPGAQPFAQTEPGGGPRHFDFHPNRKFAYCNLEIGNKVIVFAYDEASGGLQEIQSISTVPADFSGRSHTADLHIHPSGRFLYCSNRGHDSIAMYAVDEATGKLTFLGAESTQGQTPRNFAIDPTGTLLLAANQNSSTVAAYHIDQKTGRLAPTGVISDVPTPVCLKFAPAAGSA